MSYSLSTINKKTINLWKNNKDKLQYSSVVSTISALSVGPIDTTYTFRYDHKQNSLTQVKEIHLCLNLRTFFAEDHAILNDF